MTESNLALRLILDPVPDERGNLVAAAILGTGRMIAMTVNAN